ncbi:50S ribosomal protein L7/L12 [Actinomadura fibrosa]|uniref:50S ribosomal protein L7/L12 n=1 Tax=Actinomadura fibrosa TaxID=111802 RepID=A0ABW2XPQ6_9ACTN|nr:50S ribosomal protein L7/L12 [Actinomadura fibrosa]
MRGKKVTYVVHHEVPDGTRSRVLGLIAQQKMIHAIKLLREETGMGLREAKEYAEGLRDGRIPPSAPQRRMLSDRVRAFLAEEDVASAVAVVQAETGMTRAEAERFIAALEQL